MQNVHLVELDGQAFAVGLWWTLTKKQVPRGGIASLRREAKREASANKDNASPFNVFSFHAPKSVGNGNQLGLGHLPSKKPKKNTLALGSLVAKVLAPTDQSWVGCFPLGGGYWVIAVKDGSILPDGDVWFDELEDAEEAIAELSQFANWDQTIEDLEDEEEAKAYLMRALQSAKTDAPEVLEIDKIFPWFKFGLGSALVGSIGFGGYVGYELFLAEEPEPEPQPMVEVDPVYVSPWEKALSPGDAIEACARAHGMGRSDRDRGWMVMVWDCEIPPDSDKGAVTKEWQRDESVGSFSHRPSGVAFNPESPNEGHSESLLTGVSKPRGEQELLSNDVALSEFLDLARRMEMDVDISEHSSVSHLINEIDVEMPPPPDVPDDAPMPPDPELILDADQVYEWELGKSSELSPFHLRSVMDAFPGLVVRSVRSEEDNWYFKGDLYVNE